MLITFEGGEGAGKSTQIKMLADRLRLSRPEPVIVTREPGGTKLGERLRELVLHPNESTRPASRTELLIMLADRAQHVSEMLVPLLDAGSIVLCDRFTDSSIAYQGYGRGLPLEIIVAFNTFAANGLKPDLTVLLDIDPSIGLARQQVRARMEDEELAFHERIRAGFLEIAHSEPNRFLICDAAKPKADVHDAIWSFVDSALESTT